MIRIIVTEDHKILREGLVSILKQDSEIEVIDTASNGLELLNLLEHMTPDVVLLDIQMPHLDGFEATKIISAKYPSVKIIALTMHDQPAVAAKIMEFGAKGYLTKTTSKNELIYAIKSIATGKSYISGGLVSVLLNERNPNSVNDQGIKFPLSNRESEILQLIAGGLTNKEISSKLFISKRTVETHRMNLLEKTQCKNCAQLIKYGIEAGILV